MNCELDKMDSRCLSNRRCQTCSGRHHTLLHVNEQKNYKNTGMKKESSATKATMMTQESTSTVLLATAQVRVRSLHGEYIILRALMDQGSQTTSVSEDAAQLLQLPKRKTDVNLRGLGETIVGVAKSKILLETRPRFFSSTKINPTEISISSS